MLYRVICFLFLRTENICHHFVSVISKSNDRIKYVQHDHDYHRGKKRKDSTKWNIYRSKRWRRVRMFNRRFCTKFHQSNEKTAEKTNVCTRSFSRLIHRKAPTRHIIEFLSWVYAFSRMCANRVFFGCFYLIYDQLNILRFRFHLKIQHGWKKAPK